MNRGFYTIMAAQFFSSLADNALLISAIALLREIDAPAWMTPMLKLFFVVSYVALAAFVGAFADSFPKGKVMFITNLIKIGGCLLMLFGAHPLLAYAVVGFGAAAYSPAKYGILTELLPPEKLVVANGWIEGLTVTSIIVGFLLGGILISPRIAEWLLAFDLPMFDTGIDLPAESAIAVITSVYVIATLFNLGIPDTGARYAKQHVHPWKLLVGFSHCCSVLWRDKLGQISLAVTTLFWGAGATLQFIVLKWAEQVLGLDLSRAAILQAVVARRHRHRRRLRRLDRRAEAVDAGAADRRRHGPHRRAGRLLHAGARARRRRPLRLRLDELVPADRVRHPRADRRPGRLLRRADERAAAASRPRAAVGGPLDRRAELQREPQHPRDARASTRCWCGSTCRSGR